MSRPPDSVAVIARHHWLTGGAMVFFVTIVAAFTRQWAGAFELSPKGYAITLTIAASYLGTGTLVWLGVRLGRYLNYACSLIYLARPQLGLRIWRLMGTPEFKAHFTRRWPQSRKA
jgi:hypothetical protein